MANVTTPDKPGFPEVYELAVTDPVAGGPDGVDNLPHKQLAERTEYLKAEADKARTDIDAQDKRLGLVEGSSAVAVSDALRLAWSRSDEGYAMEMFSPGMTFIDVEPINVTRTVKDDDSVDVDRTDLLQVGRTYVIYGDNGQESVTVGEILNSTRFKATANLTRTLIAGKMSQTDWKIGYGKATAPASGIYYSNEVDVLRYYNDGMLNIRRDKGEGRLTISARVIGGEWQDAPLVETVEEQSGTRDEFYKLPVGGKIQLRAIADKETVVNHMMVYTSPEAGRAYPIDQPKKLTPAQGAVNVMDPVTFTGTAPYSLYGKHIASATIVIATDKDLRNVVHTGTVENPTGELSYTAPGGTHAVDENYFWGFYYTDEDGKSSLMSVASGYSTAGVFEYVVPPIIVAPANNANGVMAPFDVQLSDFNVFGTDDTHAASKVLASYNADMSDPFFDSGEVTPDVKISITEADGLVVSKDVYLQPWHRGTALGWSAAGPITHVRTADVFNPWPDFDNTLSGATQHLLASDKSGTDTSIAVMDDKNILILNSSGHITHLDRSTNESVVLGKVGDFDMQSGGSAQACEIVKVTDLMALAIYREYNSGDSTTKFKMRTIYRNAVGQPFTLGSAVTIADEWITYAKIAAISPTECLLAYWSNSNHTMSVVPLVRANDTATVFSVGSAFISGKTENPRGFVRLTETSAALMYYGGSTLSVDLVEKNGTWTAGATIFAKELPSDTHDIAAISETEMIIASETGGINDSLQVLSKSGESWSSAVVEVDFGGCTYLSIAKVTDETVAVSYRNQADPYYGYLLTANRDGEIWVPTAAVQISDNERSDYGVVERLTDTQLIYGYWAQVTNGTTRTRVIKAG